MAEPVKPPKMVKVGPFDYRVRARKHLDLFGKTVHSVGEIEFQTAQSPSNMRDTLVHESLHAILFQSGAQNTSSLSHDAEESLVVTISPWVTQWIRDNPELIAFVTERE